MSFVERVKRNLAPDVAVELGVLRTQIAGLSAALVQQSDQLHEMRAMLAGLSAGYFQQQFDSLATAQAEGMVYLNRSLREIRAEVLAMSAHQSSDGDGQHAQS